ncbi:MAG: UvrD-helicase domain-containing protein [Vicinamibacterales bacterium]
MSVTDDRHLISDALDTTLVVEAAAGTGKTTELVKRIVRLLATGRAAGIEQIVAVTFSEKAAGELKLRLREELERARTASGTPGEERVRLEAAVQRFEEAHVSTIHGFCADLLRERPVEARIDPAFEVLTEGQSAHLYDEAFDDWIQRELNDPSEGVRRSLRRPQSAWSADEEEDGPIERLRRAGFELLQWRDHPRPWTRPAGFDRERQIDALADALAAFHALSASPINPRSDYLYRATRDLRLAHEEIAQLRGRGHEDYDGWEARLAGLGAKARELRDGKGSGAQYSRSVPRQAVLDARDMLVDALEDFRAKADADLAALVHASLAGATARYEQRKLRAGVLDFLDLLIRARNLVFDCGPVRRDFQARFRFVLVDEFQDTDPLQADLLWMLAADEPAGYTGDPCALPVRPGALFVVGDPKQSIYRFRRADVGIYRDVCERLVSGGASRVRLRTSFRSVPAIQRAVNRAFSTHMTGDVPSLQAEYVELQPHRPDRATQPAVVALPVPRPYGRRQVTLGALASSLPDVVGEFVRWLVTDSGWIVEGEDGQPRRIRSGDVCLLFRRLINYRDDVTRAYVEALESRGITHLLVGGKAFHEREEVDALRTALTAIEWPDDQLSVFATLRGPFFALGEEDLLQWHALGLGFRPFAVPADPPGPLVPVAEALSVLRELNRLRNHRPVAETIGRLIEATRAHAGFVLWRGGEQVLANVLQIAELARQYEAEGGLSFRGFVDDLRRAAGRAQAPEAPILEEGSDGVRLMTVHKAKGLEFPVVILADIGCRLSRDDAQRHLDSSRGLAAIRLAGWTPLDLSEHNALEASRDEAEGVRLAYVAATRAKDLLVVPAVGDGAHEKGWVHPLSPAIYPDIDRRKDPEQAAGVPEFGGRDTVLERPDGETISAGTVRPGAFTMQDPVTAADYQVVWWDPLALDGRGDERRGLRREDLITKDAQPELVAADRARHDEWRAWREGALRAGAAPSVVVRTVTEWAADVAAGVVTAPTEAAGSVMLEDASPRGPAPRSSGRRFGTLVHAVLAAVPLDADVAAVREVAEVQARLLAADDAERAGAADAVLAALRHPVVAAARAADAAGRPVRREAAVSLVMDGSVVDGQVDLAYDDGAGWVVVDFKTDADLAEAEGTYRQQVALYAEAIATATGRPARGVLLRL